MRILLPVTSYSNDRVVEASTGAAIQLGLKHYFKGNVDHLKGVVYREPENEGESSASVSGDLRHRTVRDWLTQRIDAYT